MSAKGRPSKRTSNSDAVVRSEGRFAYEGLERAIHEKARLGILTSLSTHAGGLSFNDLKELCSLTDGNLSRHMTVLCEAGLVKIDKRASRQRTQTQYSITPAGRRRFLEYIAVLEQVVSDAVESQQTASVKSSGHKPGLSHGLA